MAKQQFTFTLSDEQLRMACEHYVERMTEPGYDVEATLKVGSSVAVRVTKRRARKAKAPKVAAVPKAAA